MYIFVIFGLGVVEAVGIHLGGLLGSLGVVVLCYAKDVVF